MPKSGWPTFAPDELLTSHELLKIALVAVQLGVRKIRITGGEPLVRPNIVELLDDMGKIFGLEQLVLTTNGLRMGKLAAPLKAAGVYGANISIDSLNADLFKTITRGGDMNRCLEGIDASLEAGLLTKLNVVVMAGVNDHEAVDFVEFARERELAVRFIEYMPTQGSGHDPSLNVPSAKLLEKIFEVTPLEPIDPPGKLTLAGPARLYQIPGSKGTVGVISPVSNHFCDDCNRVRITATGKARGCLFHETGLDLKPFLRSGDDKGLAEAMRRVVADKPEGHQLGEDGGPGLIPMSRLGG